MTQSFDPSLDPSLRRILHVDMDAFFASVEQRDNPALRGVPVAVGGSRQRGVVAAASYEARTFGVRSAMASVTARRKCPELVFVPPRFDVYKAVSGQVRDIFARYTLLIQPLSLDEAYLDVTAAVSPDLTATAIAKEIRASIWRETGLTASAGVSYNKLLAKLASDVRKPDGLFVITPRMGPQFVAGLEVGRFHGIGPVTAAKMNRLGIYTGRDLREQSLALLNARFGRAGRYYYGIARAEDDRAVEPDRVRKSIGAEKTFEQDVTSLTEARAALGTLLAKLWAGYGQGRLAGRTLTLKLKYDDFEIVTRRRTFEAGIVSLAQADRAAGDLVGGLFPLRRPVRLLGVSLSNFGAGTETAAPQLALHLPETC